MLDFLIHPSWASGGQFPSKNGAKRRFSTEIGYRRPMMSESKNQACEFLNAPPNNSDFLKFFECFQESNLNESLMKV